MNLNYFDRVALSSFRSLEKQSIYQLLCGAMMVDGNCDPREIAKINEVIHILQITSSEIEASRNLSEPTMTNCLRNMETIKKAYVGKFMAQIILADGEITQKENGFFFFIKDRLNLPDM